jgi:hypothetical protein
MSSSRAHKRDKTTEGGRNRDHGSHFPADRTDGMRGDHDEQSGESKADDTGDMPRQPQRLLHEIVITKKARQITSAKQADENEPLSKIGVRDGSATQQRRGDQQWNVHRKVREFTLTCDDGQTGHSTAVRKRLHTFTTTYGVVPWKAGGSVRAGDKKPSRPSDK